MRWLYGSLLALGVATTALASDVQFVRVWPQWHNADAFDRIGEYFGRPENDGREIVLRSRPEQRAGLYFLVRTKTAAALEGAKFVVDVVRPDSPEVKTFTFPIAMPAKSQVAELGLTDGDWPGGRDAHPVAWRVTLFNHAGEAVASEQSFLWANPSR